MVTSTNNNTKTIFRWFQSSKCITKRKFYRCDELYQLFKNETSISLSKLSFARNASKCVGNLNGTHKIEKVHNRDRSKQYRYIILQIDESLPQNIRISSRKNCVLPPTTVRPQQTPMPSTPKVTSTSNNDTSTMKLRMKPKQTAVTTSLLY